MDDIFQIKKKHIKFKTSNSTFSIPHRDVYLKYYKSLLIKFNKRVSPIFYL